MKNRAERNKDVKTAAMIIFGDSQILTSRPENMAYEDYKLLKNSQDKIIKKLFAKAPNKNIQQFVDPDLKNFQKGHLKMRFQKRVEQRKAS